MPKPFLKSLEEVPEPLRGEYQPAGEIGSDHPLREIVVRNGYSHVLKIDSMDGVSLRNVDGFVTSIRSLREENKELAAKSKAFEGMDPKDVAEWRKVHDEKKDWQKPGTDAAEIREQVRAELQGQINEATQGAEAAKREAKAARKRMLLLQEGIENGLLPETVSVVAPYLEDRFTVDDSGDREVLRMLGADGKPMHSKIAGRETELADGAEAFDILSKDQKLERFFAGHNKSGGGVTPSNGNKPTSFDGPNPFLADNYEANMDQAGQLVRENPQLARNLIAQAGDKIHPAAAAIQVPSTE